LDAAIPGVLRHASSGNDMSELERKKTIVRQAVEEVFNAGRMGAV
jgi:hypothetical protein